MLSPLPFWWGEKEIFVNVKECEIKTLLKLLLVNFKFQVRCKNLNGTKNSGLLSTQIHLQIRVIKCSLSLAFSFESLSSTCNSLLHTHTHIIFRTLWHEVCSFFLRIFYVFHKIDNRSDHCHCGSGNATYLCWLFQQASDWPIL